MVVKRLCVSDTEITLALHIHCLGLLGDRALSHYDSLSGKMVLKRPSISDTGKALAVHIHCLGLLVDTFELV